MYDSLLNKIHDISDYSELCDRDLLQNVYDLKDECDKNVTKDNESLKRLEISTIEVDEEIAMIRSASVTEDAKEQLIKEMLAYKEKVQQNRTIIRGGRFVG